MPKLCFIFIFCIVQQGTRVYAQLNTGGFYIVLDKKKECVNPFKTLGPGTPLCLSKKPIISETEFENISKIYADTLRQSKYINLRITKDAFSRLQLLAKKLPKTSLALVVDGTIVGVIENLQVIGNPIPIYSNLYSSDIEWVHSKLTKPAPSVKPDP